MNCLVDSHTHSKHSFDGTDSVESLCEAAQKQGLGGLCVTDHCDLGLYALEDWRQRLDASVAAVRGARKRYDGRLEVLAGIELGQPQEEPETADMVLGLQAFDFVIASLHNLPGTEDFYFLDLNKADIPALLCRYFDELLEIVHWGKFDSLGHITYPLRYVAGVEGITADPADYEERLRLLFAAMARSGKALEINTSGLRQRLGKTMPDAWCVRLFRDCGGEYLTLGSDAHRAADVGKGLAQAAALAEAQGFRYITYYKERRPAPIPIGKALGGILKGI